jgi:hypothetical protein
MTARALALGAATTFTPPPRPLVRRLIILVGCAGAAGSVLMALASDQLAEPGLQAGLLNWITVPYILAGVIAWSRRPDSRFGPLMVAAGFAMFMSSLHSTPACRARRLAICSCGWAGTQPRPPSTRPLPARFAIPR